MPKIMHNGIQYSGSSENIENTEIDTENSDVLTPESYTELEIIPDKFSIKSLFNKFVDVVKNIRWLKNQTTQLYSEIQKQYITDDNIIHFNPLVGSNNTDHGGCWYYKKGARVFINIAINTPNISQDVFSHIYTMPKGYRPYQTIFCKGGGGSIAKTTGVEVLKNGNIIVNTQGEAFVLGNIQYDAYS